MVEHLKRANHEVFEYDLGDTESSLISFIQRADFCLSFFIGTNIAKYWWNYAVDFYMLFTFYFFGSSNLKIK